MTLNNKVVSFVKLLIVNLADALVYYVAILRLKVVVATTLDDIKFFIKKKRKITLN